MVLEGMRRRRKNEGQGMSQLYEVDEIAMKLTLSCDILRICEAISFFVRSFWSEEKH